MEESKKEVVNNNPLLSDKSIIKKGQNYRITVLTERLVRLEYHPNGIFNDYETQLVKFRNFPKCEFEVQEDNRYLVIKTKYFTLSYTKEKPFEANKIMPMANLKVDLVGNDRSWYYNHPEVKNYKGNFISFDGAEENSKLKNGLYSIDGFASIDDSKTFVYDSNGSLAQRDGKGIDIYLFMYNNDFDLALKDYYTLTGYPAMIPRYSLGNWWSRDLDYTQDDIEELIKNFKKNNLPISVLLLDRGWHLNKYDDKEIKSSYTFNKELIPEPDKMVNMLKENNIHLGLEINPVDGIYPNEEHYKELATSFNITDDKIIAFDPLNPVLLDSIYKIMLSPLTKLGVSFYWNDLTSDDVGIDKLMIFNNSLYNNKYTNNSFHRIMLARNGLIASHRYPVTYTGRTLVGWDMLKKIIQSEQSASNIGVTWISSDVNGNYGGIEEEELYMRSVEQSVFGPIVRFHAPAGRYYRKEPWRWNAKTLEIVGRFLKLRNRMIPYIYSYAYDYHKNGNLFIKPLYYKEPWVYDDSLYKNEYFFGDMLVAPILHKQDSLINRTIHRVYVPDGIWYDFITGKKFPGNKHYISFYREEDYPIFVKRGGIIPLNDDLEDLNFVGNPQKLEIHVFPGESNIFNLYEDKDDNSEQHIITQFDYNYLPNNYTLIIRTLEGNKGVVPEYRNYKIRFRNTKKAENVICYYNDTQIKTVSYIEDSDFIVEIENVPSIGQVTLNCKGKDIEIDAMRFINDDIDSILLDLPINTVLKEQISQIMFSEIPIKRKRIEIRKLKRFNLGKEYIKLFLKLLEYIQTI